MLIFLSENNLYVDFLKFHEDLRSSNTDVYPAPRNGLCNHRFKWFDDVSGCIMVVLKWPKAFVDFVDK